MSDIQQLISQKLRDDPTVKATEVILKDVSGTCKGRRIWTEKLISGIGGCGQAFEAVIVSDEFKGKGKLQKHRLVNHAVKEEIKDVHAWTMKCYTGEEWEAEKAKEQ